MTDSLRIFGTDYTGVTGIKVSTPGGAEHRYILPSGTKTISENGTGIDVAEYSTVDVAVQSGATNFVQGSFTTGSTRGSTGTVSIPYTGTGYPIMLVVQVKGGAYNNATGGNTTWYNSLTRYDCGWYSMTKSQGTVAPTYTTSGAANYGTVAVIYKNSTSNATSYTRTSSMTINAFTSSSGNAAASTSAVKFKGNNKTLSYYIGNAGSSTIGFPPDTEMEYFVVYSS